jgi:hypothetical protein
MPTKMECLKSVTLDPATLRAIAEKDLGSILQNSISAEIFSDKFSSLNFVYTPHPHPRPKDKNFLMSVMESSLVF